MDNSIILNQQQINAVVDWLDAKDLKNTSIPLEFRICWEEILNESKKLNAERPPLGLKPKRIHDEHRQKEIIEALARFAVAKKIPPNEWFDELKSLNKELNESNF